MPGSNIYPYPQSYAPKSNQITQPFQTIHAPQPTAAYYHQQHTMNPVYQLGYQAPQYPQDQTINPSYLNQWLNGDSTATDSSSLTSRASVPSHNAYQPTRKMPGVINDPALWNLANQLPKVPAATKSNVYVNHNRYSGGRQDLGRDPGPILDQPRSLAQTTARASPSTSSYHKFRLDPTHRQPLYHKQGNISNGNPLESLPYTQQFSTHAQPLDSSYNQGEVSNSIRENMSNSSLGPREKGPSTHHKILKFPTLLVRPISEKVIPDNPDYDPKTIASDILVSAGRHPTKPALNSHVDHWIGRFADVTNTSDLATFKWNLVDHEIFPETEDQLNQGSNLDIDDTASNDLENNAIFLDVANNSNKESLASSSSKRKAPSSPKPISAKAKKLATGPTSEESTTKIKATRKPRTKKLPSSIPASFDGAVDVPGTEDHHQPKPSDCKHSPDHPKPLSWIKYSTAYEKFNREIAKSRAQKAISKSNSTQEINKDREALNGLSETEL
ncbi:MAG: hypothetical protein M1829_004389 [Trizodia sp. TS-e1964]|nr:MAG: hypothetical protein M1829_004389 [Trizodia sp. TS-e1964]